MGISPVAAAFPLSAPGGMFPGKKTATGKAASAARSYGPLHGATGRDASTRLGGGSRAAPWEGHGHPAIRPPTQRRGCSRHRLTPAMHPLWSRCWLVRIELKPKAVPTFSGKGAANRIYRSSLWFYRPSEMLLSDLAEIRRQIPVINDGGGKPHRHLLFLGHEAKKLPVQGAQMYATPSLREPFPTRTRRMFKALICCPSCQIA